MDTDRENFARDETLINRRPWYVLAAALLLLSAVAHQPLAFLAALFALVIGLVPIGGQREISQSVIEMHAAVTTVRAACQSR